MTYQLKAVATPSSASQKFTWTTSNSSIATVDSGGKVTFKQSGKKVVITAKTTDGSSRSASVSFYYNLPAPKLTITDTNIRGKNKEIQITVPWDETLLKLEATLYYEEHSQYKGQKVSISPKERMDKNGKNKVINFVGSPLENGKVYKFKIRVYNGKWSNSVEKYAMPIANVEGATVVPGNLDMVINISHREPADGTRYMIFDGVTEKEVDYKMGWRSNTTSRFSPLTNGKLYYAVAVPFRDYLGQRLWGPNQNRIYFIPMAVPTGVNVKFSGSNATASFSSDKYSDGILTLYRTEGGALKHGCESSGTSCTIKGLNSSTGYEFYVLRYQVENGKKYYSRAYRFKYRLKVPDNVDVPQGDVRVVMKNSGYTTFSIRYMNNTYGIAALYKEKDGAFRTACEKLGNSCSANLDVTKNYTFCIMQYKVIKGTKVYSNGIIAHDFSNSKVPEFERLYTGFTPVDESVIMDEIADALEYYLTEDDFLVSEALADMGEGMVTKHFEEFYEDDDFDYSSFDDDLDEFPIMKDSSIEDKVPELVEDEGLYMYRIGDKDDFYPVPSFGNQR